MGDRLRQARRELYELRFKHAVGQLENSSEISKVRHDIARIMTVLRQRDFGVLASTPQEGQLGTLEPAAIAVAEAPEVEEEPAKPKRGRKKTEEAS